MDISRAKQIIESKERIDVLYNGSPVWIEGLQGNDSAEVTLMTGDKKRQEVPLYQLFERVPDIDQ